MDAPQPLWVDTAPEVTELLAVLRDQPLYGFDTEFIRQSADVPQVALVQLSWAGGVAVVDPLAVDLARLAPVFHGPGTACGHALAQDLEIITHHLGAPPTAVFDTQVAAAFLGYRQAGLSRLLLDLLEVTLSKQARRSDWLRRPLSPAQRAYAAADVAHLLPLVTTLTARLRAADRLAWAQEDSERLRTEGISRPGPVDGWIPDELAEAVRTRADELALPAPLLATRADLAWWVKGEPPDRLVNGWRRAMLQDVLMAWEAQQA
ncbi:MAG: ribonuclease D [Myxococcales bacterium]|nr:ribonuclease D [Myxococcales bacterium]